MPLVELRDVSKRFPAGAPVLDRLSLTIAEGEFVSFIGPSGCGKSTLLRLIAGLTPVSGGVLRVTGVAPEAAAGHLAFVFQDPTLLPWLDVAANVALPLRLRRGSRAVIEDTCDRLLALVGLADKRNAFPRELSGGQRMRVSLARALALSPRLLLLDEPFGALDEMTRERLNEELLALRETQGWTGLFVTHSIAEAVYLSTRIIVLDRNPGRVTADIAVSLPYPRPRDVRLSPPFIATAATVSAALRQPEEAHS